MDPGIPPRMTASEGSRAADGPPPAEPGDPHHFFDSRRSRRELHGRHRNASPPRASRPRSASRGRTRSPVYAGARAGRPRGLRESSGAVRHRTRRPREREPPRTREALMMAPRRNSGRRAVVSASARGSRSTAPGPLEPPSRSQRSRAGRSAAELPRHRKRRARAAAGDGHGSDVAGLRAPAG